MRQDIARAAHVAAAPDRLTRSRPPRLRLGDVAPALSAHTIRGGELRIPGVSPGLTHLQFLRFANCPICNLHLQDYIRRHAEVRAAGVREVVLFHSEPKHLAEHQAHFPFDVIADPGRVFFDAYRIERSPFAVIQPRAWKNLIAGYRLRPSALPDSSIFGLPADFLIDATGRIVACHYGAHSSDQWSLDTMLRLAGENAQ